MAIQAMRELGFPWCLPDGPVTFLAAHGQKVLIAPAWKNRPDLGSVTDLETALPLRNITPIATHFPSWNLNFLICKV